MPDYPVKRHSLLPQGAVSRLCVLLLLGIAMVAAITDGSLAEDHTIPDLAGDWKIKVGDQERRLVLSQDGTTLKGKATRADGKTSFEVSGSVDEARSVALELFWDFAELETVSEEAWAAALETRQDAQHPGLLPVQEEVKLLYHKDSDTGTESLEGGLKRPQIKDQREKATNKFLKLTAVLDESFDAEITRCALAACPPPNQLSLPDDWALATNRPAPAATAGGRVKGRTWLTPTEIKDRPQDLVGIWELANADSGDDIQPLQWFETEGDTLIIHNLSNPHGRWVNLVRQGATDRWSGIGTLPTAEDHPDGTGFSICPRMNACHNLCKWAAGSLDIAAGALQIKGEWHDRIVDTTKCVFEQEPQTEPQTFDRFVGVSFAPIAAGKYMYMGMAPAVGDSPAQFKALVRIATNYAGTGAIDVKTSVTPSTATLTRAAGAGLAATYEFSTRAHGIYELAFELVREGGEVFHTDRMRIEIPAVPGLGN